MDKALFEKIVTAIGDGITVQDRNYTIIYQNPVIQELFGNCIGDKCYEAYEQFATVCDDCPVRLCYQDGQNHVAEREIMFRGKRRIVESLVTPLKDASEQINAVVEVVRDVTERKIAEERVARFRDLYAAISHTNKAIIQCTTRVDLFEHICRTAVDYGGFSLAVIGMIGQDGSVNTMAHYGVASPYLDSMVVHSDPGIKEGQGPTGTSIRKGKPYICNDFHNDPATTIWRKAALENGIRSSAAFPLTNEGVVVGSFKLYADRIGFFDNEIVNLLLEMSSNISFGLDNIGREDHRREAEEALRKSDEQLKFVLEGSSDGFCDWHIHQRIVKLSSRYCEILGYLPGELEHTPETIKNLVHPDEWPKVESFLHGALISGHPSFEIEIRMQHKSGEWKWIHHRGKVVEWDSSGHASRVAGTGTDITDKKQYMEQLHFASTHDLMTGLFNRSYYDAEIARMLLSRQYPISLVMADIDGLKSANDTFGHAVGDRLIKQAAHVLRESFRSADMVARIGGDEFAVILPTADEEIIEKAIQRVIACQIEINQLENDGGPAISISLGTATAESSKQLAEALRLADSRMYRDKQRRNKSPGEQEGQFPVDIEGVTINSDMPLAN